MALVLGLEVGAAGPTKRFSALPRPKSSSGWSSPQPVKAGWGVRCWFWRSGRLVEAHLVALAGGYRQEALRLLRHGQRTTSCYRSSTI